MKRITMPIKSFREIATSLNGSAFRRAATTAVPVCSVRFPPGQPASDQSATRADIPASDIRIVGPVITESLDPGRRAFVEPPPLLPAIP